MNNQHFYLKNLEKLEQIKCKARGRKRIWVGVSINGIKKENKIENIKGTGSWFLEKLKIMDKTLPRLVKKIRDTRDFGHHLEG